MQPKTRSANESHTPAREERRTDVPCRGVTMIEIMFAFLVMAVATLAASGLLSFGHRNTSKDFRMLAATQILTDRMNQLLEVSFATHSAELDPPETPKTFGPGAGNYQGIKYGPTSYERAGDYRVEFTLEHIPLQFQIRPFQLSSDYDPGIASSYHFAAAVDATLGQFTSNDRTSRNFYRLIRISVTVRWTEPNGVARRVDAVSFKADLQGA